MRICSLLPSATEILCELGLSESVVGVSHECDYPPEISGRAKLVRSRFSMSSYTSREIDALVAGAVSRGESIYEIDEDLLADLNPDLIITQELCEVCAVSYDDLDKVVQRIGRPLSIISLDPHSMEDVMKDIVRIGEATGRIGRSQMLAGRLRSRIEAVRDCTLPVQKRPRVACLEWLDPLILGGHWMPEMVELAGGLDDLVERGGVSRRIILEELLTYGAEVLILMPCGMDISRAVEELNHVTDLKKWTTLPAVISGQVYAVDSGSLYTRSGPRLVDGLEIMAKIIHPELFPGDLPGTAAVRLSDFSAYSI